MHLRRPPTLDLALSVALGALLLLELLASNVEASAAIGVPACVVMAGALAWRRSAPLIATGAVAGAWVALRVFDDSPQELQSALLAAALATYSVAAYGSRRTAIAGLAVVLGAAAVIEAGDLIVMGPFFGGVWLAGRVFRDRQHLAASLAERTNELERQQQETARLAIAEERARIARELHDVVAHSLSVMVVQAGAERHALGDGPPETVAALRSIEETGRDALTEMRRLLGILREDESDAARHPQAGLDRIEALVSTMRKAGLDVELQIEGERRPLPAGLDISAYRIVQEALTNVLRHAQATTAHVSIRFQRESLELEVTDDGTGHAGSDPGFGLAGMRERAALFGGELRTQSTPSGGFLVAATLPVAGTGS